MAKGAAKLCHEDEKQAKGSFFEEEALFQNLSSMGDFYLQLPEDKKGGQDQDPL